ncbi:hypothetical protein PG985_008317 [Apiospora marii]|uniref:Uncharacterized protein n=1 Tax=Apiospora marii TaxID=335849 RepID=A0ABR1SSZ3_9PEZI
MSKLDAIPGWLRVVGAESSDNGSADLHPLAKAYRASDKLYSDILAEISAQGAVPPPVLTSLQRSHDSLKLWAHGYDVVGGRLDGSLYRSRRAKIGTFRLLRSVCQTLTNRLLPLIDIDQRPVIYSDSCEVSLVVERLKGYIEEDTEDSDDDTESETSIDDDEDPSEIAEDLKTDVQCLLDLGYRFYEQPIRRASRTSEPASVPPLLAHPDSLIVIWTEKIRSRYPFCRPDVVQVLGKGQHERIIRCQQARNRNSLARLAISGSDDTSAKPASTAFRDSALGSSIPAETVLSYAGGYGGSVRVPPLPEDAANGTPFECVGCGRMKTITNKSAWKSEWENHITIEHGDSVPWDNSKCLICLDDTPEETVDASKHLADHLEQIALTGLPGYTDSEDGPDDGSSSQSSISETGAVNLENDTLKPQDEFHQSETQPPASTVDQVKAELKHGHETDETTSREVEVQEEFGAEGGSVISSGMGTPTTSGKVQSPTPPNQISEKARVDSVLPAVADSSRLDQKDPTDSQAQPESTRVDVGTRQSASSSGGGGGGWGRSKTITCANAVRGL